MRIEGMNKINEVYKSGKASKLYGSGSIAAQKDTLSLSDFAKDLQIAKQAVAGAPDVRQNRIEEVQSQIEAGTYNISASQVAEKLMKKYFE